MVKEVFSILSTGLEIFQNERKLHLAKKLKDFLDLEDRLENAVYPEYSNIDQDFFRDEWNNFLVAYNVEFSERMKNVKINVD